MSNKHLISVIMSVRNGMPYLKDAVESIFSQTYQNFEFIIVDDASTDSTWTYLKSLRNKRIKLIKNKKNLGLAASLNKALRLSKGNYIARMDADDVSLPDRLQEQVKFLLSHPLIGICGTWVSLIDEKGKIIGEKKYPTKDQEIKKALACYPPIIHPSMMVRDYVFKELKCYNPDFDMAEDYEFLIRAMQYEMANIPKKLLSLRLWDKRRSRAQMTKMDKVDLRVKIRALKEGYFGPLFILTIARKFLMIYFLPLSVKLRVAKLFKLA